MSFFVNGREVVSQGSGAFVAAISVNYTGPYRTPVPYVNIALASDLAGGCSRVLVNGRPIATLKSFIAKSQGDEAGVHGGIYSGTVCGRADFISASDDTFAGSKGLCVNGDAVVRVRDFCVSNNRNTDPQPLLGPQTPVPTLSTLATASQDSLQSTNASQAQSEQAFFYQQKVQSLYQFSAFIRRHKQKPAIKKIILTTEALPLRKGTIYYFTQNQLVDTLFVKHPNQAYTFTHYDGAYFSEANILPARTQKIRPHTNTYCLPDPLGALRNALCDGKYLPALIDDALEAIIDCFCVPFNEYDNAFLLVADLITVSDGQFISVLLDKQHPLHACVFPNDIIRAKTHKTKPAHIEVCAPEDVNSDGFFRLQAFKHCYWLAYADCKTQLTYPTAGVLEAAIYQIVKYTYPIDNQLAKDFASATADPYLLGQTTPMIGVSRSFAESIFTLTQATTPA